MNLTLHVWRQRNAAEKGRMVTYAANNVNPEMSFLEMLDVVNEELTVKGEVGKAMTIEANGVRVNSSMALQTAFRRPLTEKLLREQLRFWLLKSCLIAFEHVSYYGL